MIGMLLVISTRDITLKFHSKEVYLIYNLLRFLYKYFGHLIFNLHEVHHYLNIIRFCRH